MRKPSDKELKCIQNETNMHLHRFKKKKNNNSKNCFPNQINYLLSYQVIYLFLILKLFSKLKWPLFNILHISTIALNY